MNATKSRLMLYRFTKVVIAILIIPTLLFGIFCTVVMSNTKANGGFPSIFNYYVVQVSNNNFYNSQLNLNKAGEYQMFVSLSGADYKVGDVVSYYAGEESPENQIIIENVEWIENFSRQLPAKNLNNNFFHINSEIEDFNHNLKFGGQGLPVLNQNANQNNLLNNTTIEYEDSSADLAEVGLGKIEKIGIGHDANNESYIICSVLESPTDTVGKPILALNIIGLSTKSSPFFINLLLYSSTTISFIVMLLLPCALLISFQITNLSLVARQVRDEKIAKKRLIREIELKNQQEEFSGTKPLPSDSPKAFTGFIKGDVRLGSVGSLKNKAKVYNKEELEKIREGLLSNKKFKSTFDSEFDEDEYIDQLKNADKQKVQTKENETSKPTYAEISSSINEIPENIIESYGLNIKDKENLSKNSIPPMQKSNEKPAGSKTTSSTSTVSPTFKTSDIPPISSFGMKPSDTLQQKPDISRSSQNNEASFKEPQVSSNSSSKTFQKENTRQKFEVPGNSDFGNYFGFESKVEKPTQQKNISATSPEISEPKLNKNESSTNKANSDFSEISDLGAKFGLKNKSDLNSDEEN